MSIIYVLNVFYFVYYEFIRLLSLCSKKTRCFLHRVFNKHNRPKLVTFFQSNRNNSLHIKSDFIHPDHFHIIQYLYRFFYEILICPHHHVDPSFLRAFSLAIYCSPTYSKLIPSSCDT